ncbi:hypothetical protein [Virgisporangium aurantiacum]|nr:hypothetical protein [Virgisporangium aurantiacum]
MLIALIIAAEIGFWVTLGAGLAARYLLRWRRVSTVLLVCVPLIDVVLLVATIIDLRRGAEPEWGHGLAALYIGFSVAFGKDMIRWADERFARRFAGGPEPWKPPTHGWAKTAYEWKAWGKAMLGWAVAAVLLGLGYLLVDDPDKGRTLLGWALKPAVPLAIWFIFWPLWETMFPSKPKKAKAPLERMKDLLDR